MRDTPLEPMPEPPPPSSDGTTDEIILADLLLALFKHKKGVALIVATGFIVSVFYSLLATKVYESTVILFPPQTEITPFSMADMPQMGGISGFLDNNSVSDLWVGILKSRTLSERVIEQFDLMSVYESETIEGAIESLEKRVRIKSAKNETVSVTVEDTDPERAAKMASALVQELDHVNQGRVISSAGRMRLFVEQRLQEEKVALEKAEDTVRIFQEKNGAVQLDAQSEALVGALGEAQGQLMAKEVELQTLLSYASRHNPAVDLLKAQISELKMNLKKLEKGRENAPSKSVLIPSEKIPLLALQYHRLLRDAKVRDTLYNLLTEQYERARIQEAKDTPTVQILDPAKVATQRSKPQRTLIVLLSTLLSGCVAVFWALIHVPLKMLWADLRSRSVE
jgi:uncharacterized protein involved in exopolysaccharide biosynthesis